MTELERFILEKLAEKRLKVVDLKKHLAQECSKSTEATRKWIKGKMQPAGVEPTVRFLDLRGRDREKFYRLVTSPFASDNVEFESEHGGMTAPECKVERFYTMDQVYEFVAKQIDLANEKVCDLTWGRSETHTKPEGERYEGYKRAILRACERGILYYEVMTFYKKHPYYFNRAKDFLREQKLTYNLSFYEPPPDERLIPPLMSFLIVDKSVVVTCLYSAPSRLHAQEILLAIRQDDIIRQYHDYFDEIWRGATPLKIGGGINTNELRRLNAVYGTGLDEDIAWAKS